MLKKKQRKQLMQKVENCLQVPNITTLEGKGGVISTCTYVSPTQTVMGLITPSDVGLIFSTYPEVTVPDTKVSEMCTLLNTLNGKFIRGAFFVDEDRDLCFKNTLIVNDGDEISESTIRDELFLGLRVFLVYREQIMDIVLSAPEEGEEEFVIEGDVNV